MFGLRVSNQGRVDSPLGVGPCALCGQTAIVLTCRELGRVALSGYELVARTDWAVREGWAFAHSVAKPLYSSHAENRGGLLVRVTRK